ncbi:MAG: ATP-grasp domain-containing protein [Gammaproteobacteria bacterium]
MRLFVTEFITGGGFANHPLPEGLKQEGLLMLNSVLADCLRIHDVQLSTSLDSRITINTKHLSIFSINNSTRYMQQLSRMAHNCDYAWVIAPESSGVLESIVSRFVEENIPVINCDANTIRITGDKIECTSRLLSAGICAPINFSLSDAQQYKQKVVIKNRFGVGCEGLKICDSGVHGLENINDFNHWVVQPYIDGEQLSLSLLCNAGKAIILTCNKQIFYGVDEPKLKACLVNAVSIDKAMEALANNIAKTFPGLSGYVGVDIIKTSDDYVVIDINPRLTSSYAGLNDVLMSNPAELCIDSVLDQKLPDNIVRNSKVIEVSFE